MTPRVYTTADVAEALQIDLKYVRVEGAHCIVKVLTEHDADILERRLDDCMGRGRLPLNILVKFEVVR